MLQEFKRRVRRGATGVPSSARRILAMRHTIRRNWREDPVLFMLNVQRRRGNRSTTAVWNALNRQQWLPSRRVLALSALLIGDRATLRTRLEAGAAQTVSAGSAKMLAAIALAGDLPELATKFAEVMPASDPSAAITRAKLLWYAGDMSGAIKVLDAGDDRVDRLRNRYAAEADVFGTWTPSVAAVPAYRPEPQTVLHLVTNSLPYTESGYAQRTHSLLREQVAAGWNVHAATRLGYPQSIGAVGASTFDEIDGVIYHRLPALGSQGNMRERQQQEADALRELLVRVRPSVLHTTTHFVNALAARAVATAAGIPWIYEVRGQLADTWASKRGLAATTTERYRAFQRRESEMARSADAVITLGEEMRQGLIHSGVDEASIYLAPNAIGEAFLEEPVEPEQARAELGLSADDLHIGTVSSLVPYEGLDVLIDAFALLAARQPNVRLLIVGDGESAPELRRRTVSYGMNPDQVLPGRVSRQNASRYHQALDIFVVPRLDLSVTRAVTPLKPVEAMASSRPVVASDLPALRELVDDGKTGLIVPPGNADALATALELLVTEEGLRRQLGVCGRRTALADRTWSRSVRASLECYARLQAEMGSESE